MSIIAYCQECHALWFWQFHQITLRRCRCPTCRHRLVPAARARPRWKGHEVPTYLVGSFDVCRELHDQQARRSGVRPRAAWRAEEKASDYRLQASGAEETTPGPGEALAAPEVCSL
jgi:hypothetical protein